MKLMRTIDRLLVWLIALFVWTAAIAALYGAMQHLNRSLADDAPRALASSVMSSAAADGGGMPHEPPVDIALSREPFFIVYSAGGLPVEGDGFVNGHLARVPEGVLAHARAEGIDRVTWEPQRGLRFATVAVRDGANVIVAGQSLAATEDRIAGLGILLLVGWIGVALVLAVGATLHLIVAYRVDAGPL